ncbi:MAG TPA: PAS domain-containing protein [Candidatus Angelobacter sp.]|nr:PAS domain-containing protein [Candidatus Angelobacter sp.]
MAKVGPQINELLVLALQSLPQAVLLTEAESGGQKVIFANEAFQQLTGYSMAEMAERDVSFMSFHEIGSLSMERVHSGSHGELQSGELQSGELLVRRKDGSSFRDRITAKSLRFGGLGYSLQTHSETDTKPNSDRFSTEAPKMALAGNLVHDFNNLFTAIIVYSGLMLPGTEASADLRRYLGAIRESAERGSQLVARVFPQEVSSDTIGTHGTTQFPTQSFPTQAFPTQAKDERVGRRRFLAYLDSKTDRFLRAVLSWRGYEILSAQDAEEVLEIAAAHTGEIDLLVVNATPSPDSTSPDSARPRSTNEDSLTGKARKLCPQMKVLFLSQSAHGLNAEADEAAHFLDRPLTAKTLIQKIEELF